jgi:hypothetical protein
MTNLQALQACRDMWTWLAEHPGARKRDYPAAHHPEYVEYFCSLCTHTCDDGHQLHCEECLLLDFWTGGTAGYHQADRACTDCLDSPYAVWIKQTRLLGRYAIGSAEWASCIALIKGAALTVVEACDSRIKELCRHD